MRYGNHSQHMACTAQKCIYITWHRFRLVNIIPNYIAVYHVKSYLSSGAEKCWRCKQKNGSNRKRVVPEICFSAGLLLRDWGPRAQGQRPWAQGPQGLGPFWLNDSTRWGFDLLLRLITCRVPGLDLWVQNRISRTGAGSEAPRLDLNKKC